MHISSKKKSQSEKSYLLYSSNYMTFLKRQNYRDNTTISGYQGLEGRGTNTAAERI